MDAFTYEGKENLVIGLDIGTTQSAVAICHLFPNTTPKPRLVTKWAGQESAAGDSKIPTEVAYRNNVPIAFGAEVKEHIGEPDIHIAKWFKLHLHPSTMDASKVSVTSEQIAVTTNRKLKMVSLTGFEVPALPPGVPLDAIYRDFLKYVFQHAREFFWKNTPDGEKIWNRLRDTLTLVFAIPNGWNGDQQQFLVRQVTSIGLLGGNGIEDRIRFVSEGEASVHYAIHYAQDLSWLSQGLNFVVIDAGGSTIDSTLYVCKKPPPDLTLEEAQASECIQAGAVFVDRRVQGLLQAKLGKSKFSDSATIQEMMDEFERRAKRAFDGTQESSIIKFGRITDNDKSKGISRGRITLSNTEVRSTFDPIVDQIVKSCSNLLPGRKIEYVLLVGGFGESPYLQARLKDKFESQKIQLVTVDESSKKAAAEGALHWHFKQLVSARAARFAFGIEVRRPFNPTYPLHQLRHYLQYLDARTPYLGGFFGGWVKKNQVIPQDWMVEHTYVSTYPTRPIYLGHFSVDVLFCDYQEFPIWAKDETGNLVPGIWKACSVSADLSGLQNILRPRIAHDGIPYFQVDFKIKVAFGGTTLSAKIAWDENGEAREGPARILANSIV